MVLYAPAANPIHRQHLTIMPHNAAARSRLTTYYFDATRFSNLIGYFCFFVKIYFLRFIKSFSFVHAHLFASTFFRVSHSITIDTSTVARKRKRNLMQELKCIFLSLGKAWKEIKKENFNSLYGIFMTEL